jgi:hypothetical protein
LLVSFFIAQLLIKGWDYLGNWKFKREGFEYSDPLLSETEITSFGLEIDYDESGLLWLLTWRGQFSLFLFLVIFLEYKLLIYLVQLRITDSATIGGSLSRDFIGVEYFILENVKMI